MIEELGSRPAAARMLLAATNSYLPYYLSAEELGGRARLRREVSELARLLVAGLAAGAAPVPEEVSDATS